MNRRGFLSGILALGVAPAIVRADSLMRIVPRGLVFHPDAFSLVCDQMLGEYDVRVGNKFLTPAMYTNQCLQILQNQLRLSAVAGLGIIQEQYDEPRVIRIRRPDRYVG